MSSCKTKWFLFEMYYHYPSFKNKSQLNSFTAIHRPQDGQQKARWAKLYSKFCPGSQGVEESFPRDALPRTPRVGDGFWDPPKPNGLGNPTWRHNIIDIIWYLLIYVLFRGYQVVLHQVSHHVTSAKCENRNVHLRKKTLNYCKTYIFSACVHKSCVYLNFLKVSLVLVSYLCFFQKIEKI